MSYSELVWLVMEWRPEGQSQPVEAYLSKESALEAAKELVLKTTPDQRIYSLTSVRLIP